MISFYPATPGLDFDGTPLDLTFLANPSGGNFQREFNFSIEDDSILEFEEEFRVTFDMTAPLPDGVMFGDTSTITVTIQDDGKGIALCIVLCSYSSIKSRCH